MPYNIGTLFNSLKINIGLSLVGVIAGEFLVSKAGLGYLIVYGGQVFKLDLVMTSVIVLSHCRRSDVRERWCFCKSSSCAIIPTKPIQDRYAGGRQPLLFFGASERSQPSAPATFICNPPLWRLQSIPAVSPPPPHLLKGAKANETM